MLAMLSESGGQSLVLKFFKYPSKELSRKVLSGKGGQLTDYVDKSEQTSQ
jgi:hypothetical protein